MPPLSGKRLLNFVWCVLTLFCAGIIVACSAGKDTNVPSIALSGRVSAAPLTGSVVQAYLLNSDGSRGLLIGIGQTATDGTYSLSVPLGQQPIILLSTFGNYVEEASSTPVAMNNARLRVILPTSASGRDLGLTPLTEISAQRTIALLGVNPGASASSIIADSNKIVSSMFGITDITISPADPTAAVSAAKTAAAAKYAVALGAISQIANVAQTHYSTFVNSMDITEALYTSLIYGGDFGGTSTSFVSQPVYVPNSSGTSILLTSAYQYVDSRGGFINAMATATQQYLAGSSVSANGWSSTNAPSYTSTAPSVPSSSITQPPAPNPLPSVRPTGPQASPTPTPVPTATPVPTPTPVVTPTPTPTPVVTPTPTPTPVVTPTPTPTPVVTPTPTPTPTPVVTPTPTPTPTPVVTPTPTPTPVVTPTPTPTPTPVVTPTPTPTPVVTPTPTPTPVVTPTPTPTPVVTPTPTPTPVITPTPTPTPVVTPTPTPTPVVTPTPTPTPVVTPTPTPTPIVTPTPTPTPAPSVTAISPSYAKKGVNGGPYTVSGTNLSAYGTTVALTIGSDHGTCTQNGNGTLNCTFTGTVFQTVAVSTPLDVTTSSASAGTATLSRGFTVYDTFTVTASKKNLVPSQVTTLAVNGGKTPYIYGTSTYGSLSGAVFTANSANGTSTVNTTLTVSDQIGSSLTVNITVAPPLTSALPAHFSALTTQSYVGRGGYPTYTYSMTSTAGCTLNTSNITITCLYNGSGTLTVTDSSASTDAGTGTPYSNNVTNQAFTVP